jgi:hypothetical protein
MRQRDHGRAVAVGGEAERRQSSGRRRDDAVQRSGHRAVVVERDHVDGAGRRIRLERHEQLLAIEDANLRGAAVGRRAAADQFERGGAVAPADIVSAEDEGIDRRRAGDVEMVVAEVDADRRAGRGEQLLELQAVAVTTEDGHGARAGVHRGEELAVDLTDAARVASDAAAAIG